MRKISMWCPQCELWTKEYNRSGYHDCGTEVISTGNGSLPDIDYEGVNVDQVNDVMSGVCRVCGCTDNNACVEFGDPCYWVTANHDLCSACKNLASS